MWNAVSSRIWTRVAGSISYDDNHYTTGSYCYTSHNLTSVTCFHSLSVISVLNELESIYLLATFASVSTQLNRFQLFLSNTYNSIKY